MKTKQWIIEMIIFLLALLFFYTALSKLIDLDKFTQQINNQPFNNRYTPFLVYGIPSAELLVTSLLLIPKTRSTGLFGAAFLMLVFTVYVGLVTFHFYDRIPCGCATAFAHLTWPQHLILNIFFLILSYLGIYLHKKAGKA